MIYGPQSNIKLCKVVGDHDNEIMICKINGDFGENHCVWESKKNCAKNSILTILWDLIPSQNTTP